ncbi:hypothetical protein BV25DRAFT_1842025 [Artomyces pyxidatus]|uniref:Uncharacterized protein n=1 Tax=Artomyces pyxidatus TaxID=48021 RepID=A0ACB8SJY0_9AGAM|nr:hypothetical protein BV25DRAFT_1842025 [Artomyces pyxidatus]
MPRKASDRGRGRPRWAQGTKLEFLLKRVPDYQKVEGDKLRTKTFYDRLARLFVIVFGKYALSGEPPEGIEEVDDSVLDQPSTYVDETEEEREAREATYAEVRKRVASFFQTNQRRLSSAKKTDEASESFEQLIRQLVKQPRREQAVHVYSKLHWEATLKPKFQVQWAKEVAEAGRKGKEMPVELEVRNRVIRGCWKKEEDSTRAAVLAAVESRYQSAVEDYKKTFIDAPLTDEDKEWAVSSAYLFLQPIVNMVAQRFGVVASLLMAGPVPSKGGQIDVLSVHAGRTRGLVPEIWPRYDRAGFREAASSLSGFAHVVYGADTRPAESAGVGSSQSTAGATNDPDFNDFNPTEYDDDDNNADSSEDTGGSAKSLGSTPSTPAVIERQDGPVPPVSTSMGNAAQHQRPVLKPATWPPYFRKVHEELQSFKLGEDWQGLIRRFFEFEQTRGFDGKHLACDLRPHEVSLWIKNARIWNRVSIVNHENFAGRWWRWWESLQPGNRLFSDDLPAPTAPSADMNWSKVDVAGMNGLLSVVAGLAMWGLEAAVSYADMEPWLGAVRDVCEVLRVVEEARQRGSVAKDNAAKSSSKTKARTSTRGAGKSTRRRRDEPVQEAPRPKKRSRRFLSGVFATWVQHPTFYGLRQ